ncbi:amino acid ABC transporter substrate-binding protein [Pusillimonas sp. DMV24BSW_D]|uniref:amino acid ABC transporter substrate-binding protein n=1 Tax=Neopusillimonas aestuarii TaxID=2716226 RepID=UPI00140CC583|nr:amino acid ABC transporter substrate-binding protein [Pusillimonas sp. DMV24BSW_D]QIM49296.1 amino acid ABC transporter substrate-binding protein [Pusillimonas sp. DMV24BSW_D]
MRQLQRGINAEKVELHQIFGANLFIAHVVDYIQAIRRADGIKETRVNLVKKFDQVFSVPGARIGNRKIELIDAVNNALKHIRLDPTRYKELEQHYGPISFQSLVQEGERNRPDFYRLFFDSEKYYCS